MRRRATDDDPELLGRVVVEPEGHAEAVAQWSRQEPRARGGSDERERRHVEGQRSRGRPLPDDDVEAEVLQSRVEDLLDGAAQPVDLVDEEHVSRLHRGEDRGHVAFALQRRAGHAADAHAELLAHDVREARLPETRRADEQDVVERLTAGAGGFEGDPKLLLDALLADELVEAPRPQRELELFLVGEHSGREELLGHAAFSACRTRSSGESSGSVVASARSASVSE